MKATCSACQRVFETSEIYVKMVQAGKIESLCAQHDGSHEEEGHDEEDEA